MSGRAPTSLLNVSLLQYTIGFTHIRYCFAFLVPSGGDGTGVIAPRLPHTLVQGLYRPRPQFLLLELIEPVNGLGEVTHTSWEIEFGPGEWPGCTSLPPKSPLAGKYREEWVIEPAS
jgi:hypothetical protein